MLISEDAPADLSPGTTYLSTAISAMADGPLLARRAVRRWLTAAEISEEADTALLLTNELVTNAQQHAPGPARLRLFLRHGLLRCEVLDSYRSLPVLIRPYTDHERGRGLGLVDTLALCWGSTLARHSKTVWFELPVPSAVEKAPKRPHRLPSPRSAVTFYLSTGGVPG
ncbi:ATP-binding protein [Streptomyces sp. NPDC050315]|uniref:ATP-binding protein n=1 Tax=Streptomyces sp. NPDC050315 TaxID=3155039 RepID=UPI00341D453B